MPRPADGAWTLLDGGPKNEPAEAGSKAVGLWLRRGAGHSVRMNENVLPAKKICLAWLTPQNFGQYLPRSVALLLRRKLIAIVVEHEQTNHRRQIAFLPLGIDCRH